MEELKLQIQSGSSGQEPAILDDIVWETQRKGSPGKLTFSVVADKDLTVEEGSPVKLTVDGTPMFYGFVFRLKRDKSRIVHITAYDQMRYLKNKDTYNFEKTTASGIISAVAGDYGLTLGSIAGTSYMIPAWIADDKALIDIMQEALEMELTNTRQLYVLYDDAGKLTLKNAASMKVGLLIDAETAENYDYDSNIDENTYNRVLLVYEDSKTKARKFFEANGGNTNWGTLQYFEKLSDEANAQNKANALLSLYNAKTKHLTISNAFGDVRVRAGSVIMVRFDLGDDIKLDNFMMVENCKHVFREKQHFMTLKLMGGEFVG